MISLISAFILPISFNLPFSYLDGGENKQDFQRGFSLFLFLIKKFLVRLCFLQPSFSFPKSRKSTPKSNRSLILLYETLAMGDTIPRDKSIFD